MKRLSSLATFLALTAGAAVAQTAAPPAPADAAAPAAGAAAAPVLDGAAPAADAAATAPDATTAATGAAAPAAGADAAATTPAEAAATGEAMAGVGAQENGTYEAVPTPAEGTDASGSPQHMQGAQIPPQIDLMYNIALGMDANEDGRIDENEFAEFTRLSWFAKDANNDGAITEEEYKSFDFGFDYIADARGRTGLFDQVKTDLFAYWDGDDDGKIVVDEIVNTARTEFANSDFDGDGQVTGRELAFGSPTFNATIYAAGRR